MARHDREHTVIAWVESALTPPPRRDPVYGGLGCPKLGRGSVMRTIMLIVVMCGTLAAQFAVAMFTLRATSGTWEKLADRGDLPDEAEMWVYRPKLVG